MEMKSFNEQIIEEFRANQGKVAMFADYPMVILHTRGAKSGKTYLVPLVLTIDKTATGAEDLILFASFAGSQKHPVWVHNLRAHPEIEVELGSETFTARLVELDDETARARVTAQTRVSEQFAKYVESAHPRNIPVFRIERQQAL